MCVHIASKWNLFASWSLSRKSSFLSRQWRNTIISTIRPHVPTKASPVSVMPRLGVIKSLASQCPGSLGGLGITYIWELGIIYKENNSSIVALGCTLFVFIHFKTLSRRILHIVVECDKFEFAGRKLKSWVFTVDTKLVFKKILCSYMCFPLEKTKN